MKTNFKPEELKPDEKANVCKCFDDFIENEYLQSGRSISFDILEANKYIVLSRSEKIEYYKQAQKILLEIDSKKPKGLQKPAFYSGARSYVVTIKAKVLILESYFAKIDASGKHLKQILK